MLQQPPLLTPSSTEYSTRSVAGSLRRLIDWFRWRLYYWRHRVSIDALVKALAANTTAQKDNTEQLKLIKEQNDLIIPLLKQLTAKDPTEDVKGIGITPGEPTPHAPDLPG